MSNRGEQEPSSTLQPYIEGWNPAAVTADDLLAPGPVRALAAVLGDRGAAAPPDGALPLLWHWLYFLDWPAHEDLGADGHPATGHFLPPIPDRRRMFAGGRVRADAPLVTGRTARRVSTLADTVVKHGRSGEMLFVTVRHEFHQDGRRKLVEEQDLVYRSGEGEKRRPPAKKRSCTPERGAEPWWSVTAADPVLLFRFSALTGNAHRIHYDEPYARDVEDYPGLVVHGPLLALLMAGTAEAAGAEQGRCIAAMEYRLRRPVSEGEPFAVAGGPTSGSGSGGGGAELTVRTAPSDVSAEAAVTYARP